MTVGGCYYLIKRIVKGRVLVLLNSHTTTDTIKITPKTGVERMAPNTGEKTIAIPAWASPNISAEPVISKTKITVSTTKYST